MRIVAALGGNALLQRGERPGATIQRHHVEDAVSQLAPLALDNDLVITHGNGPQVGLLANESASDPELSKPYPFDVIGAQTQGMIGYWLLQAFTNALPARRVAALVTQTVVDGDDPAFKRPTKFVGIGYRENEALRLAESNGWTVAQDGELWRRVVPSPNPIAVVESSTIESMTNEGVIVICAGGGGIPVRYDRDGHLVGVEAVIDKDLATALVAQDLHADVMLILTDVPGIYFDFGKPKQRLLMRATVKELREMTFSSGSMAPKVEAACRFAEATGTPAVIGSLDDARGLLAGTSGTTITSGAPPGSSAVAS